MQPDNIIGGNIQTNTAIETDTGMVDRPIQAPQTTPMNLSKDVVFKDKPKKNIGLILGVVFLILLAAGGAGFGTWAYLSGNQQQEQLNSRINELNQQNNELQEKLNNVGTATNSNPTEATNTENYVYVGEWGYKIKIPEDLAISGYSYVMDAGYTKIYISGTKKGGGQYFPDFANMDKNTVGLGTAARYPKGTEMPQASAPQLVFSDDDYDYYYYPWQVSYSADSNDETEQAWETETRNIIENMLTNPDNYSKI